MTERKDGDLEQMASLALIAVGMIQDLSHGDLSREKQMQKDFKKAFVLACSKNWNKL